MNNTISLEETQRVKTNLDKYDKIRKYLGNDWINDNILNNRSRSSVHAIFWHLYDSHKAKLIEKWLDIIYKKNSLNIFQKIIQKIKNSKDERNFLSLLPEIEIYAYYLNLKDFKEVMYEPNLISSQKKADLKLITINDEIYIEITRIFPDEISTKREELLSNISLKLAELRHPYYIDLKIFNEFKDNDICEFIIEMDDFFKKIEHYNDYEKYSYQYIKKNTIKAEILILKKTDSSHIKIRFHMSSAQKVESSGRLKFKLIDESDQLPVGTNNVIILDIKTMLVNPDNVDEAIYGQEGIEFNKEKRIGRSVRFKNGFIHTEIGKNVGLIMSYDEYNYANRLKYVNPFAVVQLPKDLVDLL